MRRSRHIIVASALLLLAISGRLTAQIPNGYYNNANGKTGDELKTALHDIIAGHITQSYDNLWTAFWSTDNKGDGTVWDMYSDGADYTYNYSNGTDQCGSYENEGDCYNREHSWPESWFGSQNTPRTDLHHIFPTDGFVNSKRSNHPFGEVNTVSWTSQNGSKLGTCKSSLGYNGTVFEPIDEYKGDFARALFYMSVRYYGEDDGWGTSGMTNKSEILPWALQMLLNWSDNDPVSQKEIDRNNVIYSDYQHNRNPFVDHPEYARMIWDSNWHGSTGGYEKVTSTDAITDGDYLIVCENSNVAFNGSLTTLDAAGNKIDVTISGNVIESNAETDAAAFTITAKTGGYSIKSASGLYIGNTSNDNALKTSQTDTYTNTISITDGNADIVCSSSHLRYNAENNQNRFRYYKSSSYTGQQAIQLYKKIAVYSINLASVENGSISADAEVAVEGTTITLTATPNAGYELDHWTVTASDGSFVPVTNNQFVMPASNVTVSAVFVAAFSPQYHLVTNANQLIAGRTYLIVNTEFGKALGKTQNTNNRSAADVTISSNVISDLRDACELVLGGQNGAWTFFDANWGNNGGYLYAASSSSNYLKTQATINDNGKWSIEIANNGVATIKAQGNNTRNWLRYNKESTLFSCYASGQQDVCLFIRSEAFEITGNTTEAHLFPFDKHTVRNGATLSISGTATSTDANLLIIEDGGQFVHHNGGVQATITKNIAAYTADGGWYTLATPFVSFVPSGTMLSDNYDLYAYDEDADWEWVNQKANQEGFEMVSGTGYLYAHNPESTLRMSGTLNSGDHTQTIELSYGNSDESLRGFNLLGNPTAHEVNFSKTELVSDGYYYLSNDGAWAYQTGNTVPMGRGFLVKANAGDQTVTINPQRNRETATAEAPYLCLSIDGEKAYVKLGEGVSMPLLDMMGHQANFYLTREGKPFAMLVRNEAPSVDLNFEAAVGSHILKADTRGLDLDYLHLVDHKTGADVDLLVTPDYAFESQAIDYASRFQLRFAPADKSSDDDVAFAFISNGNFIVPDAEANATLQIVDMTGRVIVSGVGIHTISVAGMSSGLYLLRLIDGDTVKVQKMMVR